MSHKEIKNLYLDIAHFNENGAVFYTATILPALIEVFDSHAG